MRNVQCFLGRIKLNMTTIHRLCEVCTKWVSLSKLVLPKVCEHLICISCTDEHLDICQETS